MPQFHKCQALKARLAVTSLSKQIRLLAATLVSCTLLFGNLVVAQQSAPMSVGNKDSVAAPATIESMRTLVVRQPALERELAGGEIHKYQVQIEANQFLRVVVEQKGIDVVAVLFDPSDKQVAEIDSPNGTQGAEIVSTVTDAAGAYYVEVRSLEKTAPRGLYDIKIAEQRTAKTEDRQQIAAKKTFAEGIRLQTEGTAESLRQAKAKFEETLPLYRILGDRGGEAVALSNIGRIFEGLGELRRTLENFEAALLLYRAVGDRIAEVVTLNEIGMSYRNLGELQRAVEYFEQALPLSRLLKDRRAEILTINNIGSIYHSLGDLKRALEYYDQTLSASRAIKDSDGEASALHNIGRLYTNLGDSQRALENFEKALPLMQALGDRRGEASALNGIGAAYQELGDSKRALEYLTQSISLKRLIGDRRGEAIALVNIGSFHETLGEPERAVETFEQGLALARTIQDPYLESAFLFKLAQFKEKRGDLDKARADVEAALAIVESLRTKVDSQELRSSYFASVQNYYDFYIRLLMQQHRQFPDQGHDAAALSASERAKARSLLENLVLARVDVRAHVDPTLLDRQGKLEQELSAVSKKQQPNAEQSVQEQQKIEQKLVQLTHELEKVQTEIKTKSPHYAALTQPEPLTLQQIQREVLDADTLLLEYKLGEEASYGWAVTTTTIHGYELPKRVEVEAAAGQVYDLLQARNLRNSGETLLQRTARIKAAETEFPAAAAKLSQILLAPVKAHFGNKRLLIVADGALNYIPFAALPNPFVTSAFVPANAAPPLIANHEIVKLPSASVLAVQRRELSGRTPAARQVAVIADPVFEATDERMPARSAQRRGRLYSRTRQTAFKGSSEPSLTLLSTEKLPPDFERAVSEIGIADAQTRIGRLPFARAEAEQILALASQSQSLGALDFAASRATAVSPKLSEYRIVHFATHGMLNNAHPELSGLVLSLIDEQGRPIDGFLRLRDVYNLKLSADLVVLSACQTALGKNVRGEGLTGLVHGFMYAGSERVVASLWKVDDEATSELMSRFYQKMLRDKLPPSAALRAAQKQMQQEKRFTTPYYWAAFELQGEWK